MSELKLFKGTVKFNGFAVGFTVWETDAYAACEAVERKLAKDHWCKSRSDYYITECTEVEQEVAP